MNLTEKTLLERVMGICFPDPVKKLVADRSLADRVRGEQVLALRSITPAMLAVTIVNVLVSTFILWPNSNQSLLLAWSAVALFVSAIGGLKVVLTRNVVSIARPAQSTRKPEIHALLMGLIWAFFPVLFFADATTEQRVFIACVSAGMMGGSAVVLSMLPRAAAFATISIGVGVLCTLLVSGSLVLWIASLMLLNFAFALMRTVSLQGDRFVQGLLDKWDITRSRETIGLLLKEFEESSSDWIWETDHRGRITNPSHRFCEAVGLTAEQLSGTYYVELMADLPLEERKKNKVCSKSDLEVQTRARNKFRDVLFRIRSSSGLRWWVCSGQPIFDENDVFQGYRGAASDVSEQKDAELKLSHLAKCDHLTGLANRSELVMKLDREIRKIGKTSQSVSVLYLDLDKFKSINDTLGHSAGDQVLREIASRIQKLISPQDMVARIGGDEFAIVQCGKAGLDDAITLSNKILASLVRPFRIDTNSFTLGTSIGIALCDCNNDSAEELLHNADLALYRAKAEGRGIYKVYAEQMDVAQRERHALELDLRSAVGNKELELFYQPLADINTGEILGFEALVRWNHPTRGRVLPDVFISLAEDVGLIQEIGDWVLDRACRDAASWPGQQKVAVNLSGKQLRSYKLVQKVVQILGETGLQPGRLELEVTESVLISDPDMTIRLLNSLRELGVKVSLDDFGTGYSSLSYLVRFPFDKLKIDKSFVQSAHQSHENLAIVRSILSLAKNLKITTLAEGVEEFDQLSLLRQEGCQQVQGYLLDKPMPISAIEMVSDYDLNKIADKKSLQDNTTNNDPADFHVKELVA